jgi:hypothetical protein
MIIILILILLAIILVIRNDIIVPKVRMYALCSRQFPSLPSYKVMVWQVWKWTKKQWRLR